MRLATLKDFSAMIYAPTSAPSIRTLRARIDRGDIPGGQKDGARYYVDMDAYDRAKSLRAGVSAKLDRLAANPVLQGLT